MSRRTSSDSRLRLVADSVRTQLWPVPTVAVILAIGLGIGLPIVDEAVAQDIPPRIAVYLFGGGADAARTILQVIAGSLVTATSLTFSLTVVTLQLASTQFSPRLLRTFTADRVVHVTLALFVGTFVYALTVLRTVRTADDEGALFVPQISVTLSYVLAIASVMGLVIFLAHLVQELRVETMMRRVHDDAMGTVRRLLPERDAASADSSVLPSPTADEILIGSAASGFLLRIDEEALLAAAEEQRALIRIDREPGASLIAGVPVATAWRRDGEPALSEEDADSLRRAVARALTTGAERTSVQDVGFGLRQLVDVATKALSPGVNDPTTAVHVLGHTSALLCEMAQRQLGPRVLDSEDGDPCVILNQPRFAELLDLVVAQPRLYGFSDPAVAERVLRLLQEVAWCARDVEARAAVMDQLERSDAAVAAGSYADADRQRLLDVSAAVKSALVGRWRHE